MHRDCTAAGARLPSREQSTLVPLPLTWARCVLSPRVLARQKRSGPMAPNSPCPLCIISTSSGKNRKLCLHSPTAVLPALAWDADGEMLMLLSCVVTPHLALLCKAGHNLALKLYISVRGVLCQYCGIRAPLLQVA